MSSLQGWSLPQSTTGLSALVPAPPWHFSGELLGIDFLASPEVVASLLPSPLLAPNEARCSIVFADWSSSASSDPRIGREPGRGQYREAYVVIDALLDERKVARVPYIWVDSDLSLVRGLLQGFPKKFGEIRISRAISVGRGGPKREADEVFRAYVSSTGRRLATAEVTLREPRTSGVPTALARPIWHTRLFPDLAGGDPLVRDLARNLVTDFEVANYWVGDADLLFGAAEFDEVDALEPASVLGGWTCSLAFTVSGSEVRTF